MNDESGLQPAKPSEPLPNPWRDCLPRCHAGGGCKKIGVKWVARHILYCDDHGGAWLLDAPWAELARVEGV